MQAKLTYIAKRESIASLKLTLKHTITAQLCLLNLAEFAVCVRAGVRGYQITHTHTLTNTPYPPYQSVCVSTSDTVNKLCVFQ